MAMGTLQLTLLFENCGDNGGGQLGIEMLKSTPEGVIFAR